MNLGETGLDEALTEGSAMLTNNTYLALELARQRQAETTSRMRPGHVELASHGRRRRRRSRER